MEEEKENESDVMTDEQTESKRKSDEKKRESQNGSGKKDTKTKKKGKKTNGKKTNGKKADVNKELIQLPPCQHAYCLGEVLKKAGIEPGLCRPRPLPWALTGNLMYLPGWEKECRDYRLQQVCYEVKPRKMTPDQERYAKELREAKILWSFLEPALLYPMNPVYEDPEPGIVCECKAGTCKRNPPPESS